MRQNSLYDRGIVRFPNKYCYVFNEQYIELEDSSVQGVVNVVVSDTEHPTNHKDILAYICNGNGSISISNLLQMLFDNPQEQRCKYLHVDVYTNKLQIVSFHIYAIWGYSEIKDKFACFGDFNDVNGNLFFDRHLVWYTNLPFSVQVFRRLDGEKITINGVPYEGIETKMFDIPSELLSDSNKRVEILIDRQGGFVRLFDGTFDTTFIEHYDRDYNERIILTPCSKTEGIYLRWVDKFGYLNHYLFDCNEVTLNTSSSSDSVIDKNNAMALPVSISVVKTITCAAVSVNDYHTEYVEGICKSPMVQMLLNGEWVSVYVESSIKENAEEVLRDLEVSISLSLNRQSIA